jgi:hypothetical protein
MSEEEISAMVWRLATDFAKQGPGWSQEGVVLRAARDRIARDGNPDLTLEQRILNAWHDLFTEKKLAWGYDLDNPGSPFFHVR